MIAMAPYIAFDADDVRAANAAWKANCGPCALGACLGWTLDAVRPHLGDFERRGYMDTRMMRDAIESAGFRRLDAPPGRFLPVHGLVRVLFHGPWMKAGVPAGARAGRTHWIASKRDRDGEDHWIFDVNSGWIPAAEWEAEVVPMIAESIPRADGTSEFTHRWEVRRAR